MWQVLASLLWSIAVPIAKKVAVGLGLGFVAYLGFDSLLEFIIGWIEGSFSALPSALAHMAGRLGVDTAASIIVSAGVVKLTMRALMGGASYHPVWRNPGNQNLPA